MLPQTLKERKSYLEQYYFKKLMANYINDNSIRENLLPQIRKLKTRLPIRNKSRTSLSKPVISEEKSNGVHVESPQQSSNSKGDSFVETPAPSLIYTKRATEYVPITDSIAGCEHSPSFAKLLLNHANLMDLTKYERECLGFPNEEPESLEIQNAPPSIFDRTQQLDKMLKDSILKSTSTTEKTGQVGEDDSGWTKLFEAITFKNWLTPENSELPGSTIAPQLLTADSDSLENVKRDSNYNLPLGFLTKSINQLFDQFMYEIDENNLGFQNQHAEMFKSFTEIYITELQTIWSNRDLLTERERYAKIMETLQVWIFNLSEQNLSLAKAYDESYEESEKLRSVLLQSRNSMRIHQKEKDEDKSRIVGMDYELSQRDRMILKLKCELELELIKTKDVRGKLDEALTDVDSLTELIIRLRDNGVWDIHGLVLGDAAFQKIFNGDYYLHGAKVIGPKQFSSVKREWRNEIDILKSECDTLKTIISAKDREIQRCKTSDYNTKS